ncbi:uncharacterized protein LOC125235584 [Leguminivora glycinivorella]|uniref:uncharacterized protein LOC125235584 n=1 Tax=Leguminivora glycinivorella TaxID=1035111 RepID=UPI00201018D9|nr:uncharacterized protein LOC125235584 [Leguminivora glycinivorella]
MADSKPNQTIVNEFLAFLQEKDKLLLEGAMDAAAAFRMSSRASRFSVDDIREAKRVLCESLGIAGTYVPHRRGDETGKKSLEDIKKILKEYKDRIPEFVATDIIVPPYDPDNVDVRSLFREIVALKTSLAAVISKFEASMETITELRNEIKWYVDIKLNKGRGVKTTKGYVAVFVCMATKAVHFELVSDLSTSAFIAALKRMSARRGKPSHMYSDNGTNLTGANNVLQQELAEIQQIYNNDFLTEKLTYEEFYTVLAHIEGCMNSRPLCAISEDPDDLDYLTPSHFLSSGPVLTILDTEQDERTRWHRTQKIHQDLWKRWQSEYLCQLSVRSKWKQQQENLKINDIVIIHEPNLPSGKWAMGRVVQLHPGNDGLVRVIHH